MTSKLVLGQLLDGVERCLSDKVKFKSQVTSDCETKREVVSLRRRALLFCLEITSFSSCILVCSKRLKRAVDFDEISLFRF